MHRHGTAARRKSVTLFLAALAAVTVLLGLFGGAALRNAGAFGPVALSTFSLSAVALAGAILAAYLGLRRFYMRRLESEVRSRTAELVAANAQLLDAERRWRALVENIPIAVSQIDREGRVRFVNRERELHMGRPAGQLIGRTMAELFEPADAKRREALLRRALAGEEVRLDEDFELSDGRRRFVEGRIVPHLVDGQVESCLVLTLDVTERIMLEKQVVRSQKLDSLGQMAGRIAHDFNNVLSVILGNAFNLVSELAADEPKRQCAELIVKASRRGADLTLRLLTFARCRALTPEPVDIDALLAQMSTQLRALLGEKIRLELDCERGAPRALADAALVEIAILGLAANARDAMPDGGVLMLELRQVGWDALEEIARPELSPGRYLRLRVTDTGHGMAADTLAHCFEPFFTTKPARHGTGFGLSMVYGVIKQLGGHVGIGSAVGVGTTVTIHLPEATQATTALPERPAADAPAPKQAGLGAHPPGRARNPLPHGGRGLLSRFSLSRMAGDLTRLFRQAA